MAGFCLQGTLAKIWVSSDHRLIFTVFGIMLWGLTRRAVTLLMLLFFLVLVLLVMLLISYNRMRRAAAVVRTFSGQRCDRQQDGLRTMDSGHRRHLPPSSQLFLFLPPSRPRPFTNKSVKTTFDSAPLKNFVVSGCPRSITNPSDLQYACL